MPTPVVLIAGDGIGPEVTVAMKAVVEAAGADVAWVEALAGLERFSSAAAQQLDWDLRQMMRSVSYQ